MMKISLLLAMSMLFVLVGLASAANFTSNTATLRIIGLPKGAILPLQIQNPLGTYTTIDYQITNYTTYINISYSNSLVATYHGKIPYQFMGAGTTLAYNNTVYTLNESSGLFKGFVMAVNATSTLPFYEYYNPARWNATQAAELEALGINNNTAMLIAHVSNVRNSTVYGSTVDKTIIPAGTSKSYAQYNSTTGSVVFANTLVTKNPTPACIYISLSSVPFCSNATTPQRIPIVTFNGHVGSPSGPTYYWLNVSFVSNLVDNNSAPFNYTIKDLTNGTYLIPTTTATTSSLHVTASYKIPASQQIEISAGSAGNANYSSQYIDPVTYPSGASYYQQISITNANGGATLLAGSVVTLRYPAGAYSSYLAANLMNIEIFNGISGAVIPAWIEGNGTNEMIGSGLSHNSIYIDVRWPYNLASGNTINDYYIAYMPTTTANWGTDWGAAPQLYCASGCPATSYAGVDNGNNVFPFYSNFSGTSLNSKWGSYTASGGTVAVNNRVTLSSNGGTAQIYTSVAHQTNVFINALLNATSTMTTQYSNIDIGLGPSGGAANGYPYGGEGYNQNSCAVVCWNAWLGGQIGSTSTAGTVNPLNGVLGFFGYDSQEVVYYNYLSMDSATQGPFVSTSENYTIMVESTAIQTTVEWFASMTTYSATTQTYGAVQAATPPACTATISSPSNTITDAGQYVSATLTESNCVSPYTYTVQTSNSISLAVTNTITSGSTSATSYTATFYLGSNDLTNSPEQFNGIVTDSAANTVNSIYSSTFTVNPALGIPTLTESNTIVDAGQYILFTATASGGTSPYTYNFLVTNTVTEELIANYLVQNSASSQTFLWHVQASAGGNVTEANVIVTDSATTKETANSIKSSSITIDYPLSIPTISTDVSTPSNQEVGNVITFSSYESGGTTPYTYNFLVYNSITNVQLANDLTTSNTFSWTVPQADVGNTVYGNVIVTDSASTPASANSIHTGTLTLINSTVFAVSLSGPTNDTVDAGQSVTYFTASVTGGSGPYTYNFVVINTITDAVVNSTVFSSVSSSSNTFKYLPYGAGSFLSTMQTLKANVIVTDSSSAVANSIYSPLLTVNPTLVSQENNSNQWSLPSQNLGAFADGFYDIGQTVPISWQLQAIYPSGAYSGTPPYIYNGFVANVVSGAVVANSLSPRTPATSNTFYLHLTSGFTTGRYSINAYIIDSSLGCWLAYCYSTTQNAMALNTEPQFCSICYISVNSALATPILSENITVPGNAYPGNIIAFNALASGGTTPYTYDFNIRNAKTGAVVANMLTTSNSFAWTVPSSQVGNNVTANVVVIDSASTPEVANSIYSANIVVQTTYPHLTIFPSNDFAAGTPGSYIYAAAGVGSDPIDLYIGNTLVDSAASGSLTYGITGFSSGVYTVNAYDSKLQTSNTTILQLTSSGGGGGGGGGGSGSGGGSPPPPTTTINIIPNVTVTPNDTQCAVNPQISIAENWLVQRYAGGLDFVIGGKPFRLPYWIIVEIALGFTTIALWTYSVGKKGARRYAYVAPLVVAVVIILLFIFLQAYITACG